MKPQTSMRRAVRQANMHPALIGKKWFEIKLMKGLIVLVLRRNLRFAVEEEWVALRREFERAR